MKFMILVLATAASERGDKPSAALMQAMEDFHTELAQAGVLVDAAGLRPTRHGWRHHFDADGSRRTVEGPFEAGSVLLAGYTLIDVPSRADAMAWTSRFPRPFEAGPCAIEVRPLFEAADFEPGGDMHPG